MWWRQFWVRNEDQAHANTPEEIAMASFDAILQCQIRSVGNIENISLIPCGLTEKYVFCPVGLSL